MVSLWWSQPGARLRGLQWGRSVCLDLLFCLHNDLHSPTRPRHASCLFTGLQCWSSAQMPPLSGFQNLCLWWFIHKDKPVENSYSALLSKLVAGLQLVPVVPHCPFLGLGSSLAGSLLRQSWLCQFHFRHMAWCSVWHTYGTMQLFPVKLWTDRLYKSFVFFWPVS